MALGAPNVASVGLRVFPDMTGFRTKLVFGLQTPLLQTAKFGLAAFAGLGAALGSLGVLGSKAFYDIEKSMAKVVGLVGIAKEEAAIMTDSLADISRGTAVAPAGLAEALFFITSAGIRDTADALDVLNLSAKASTAGLGSTKVVADAVTSAVNAYGIANLSAAKATDILVATVREGKVEADSVAQSLGRVIPVAAELGVSFDQVGATVASLTRLGLDASESTTALRAILFALIRPSRGAEKELGKVGKSTQDLRDQLRGGQSVIDLLLELKVALAGNDEALARVFPRVRGLTGVLNLVGNNADIAAGIFDRMADSTGDLDAAFGAVADTSGFKFQQAMAEMQATLMTIGQSTLPAFAGILEDVKPAMGSVSKVVIGATQAFADFIVGIGQVVKWIASIPGPARTAAAAILAVSAALFLLKTHPIVAALSLVAGAITLLGKNSREAKEEVAAFKTELETMGDLTPKALQDMLDPKQISLMRKWGITLNDMKLAITQGNLPKEITAAATGLEKWNAARKEGQSGIDRSAMRAMLASGFDPNQARDLIALGDSWMSFAGNYGEASTQINEARVAAVEESRDKEALDAMHRNLAVANDLDVAMFGLSTTSAGLETGLAPAILTLEEMATAAEDAYDAMQDLLEETLKAADPAFNLIKTKEALDDAKAALNDPDAKDEDKGGLLTEALTAQAAYDAATVTFSANQETSMARLGELYDELGVDLPETWRGIIAEITDVPDINTAKWRTVGYGIRDGIINGVENLAPLLRFRLNQEIAKALYDVKMEQEIRSPSRKWAREVGAPIAAGIAVGVSGGGAAIGRAANQAIGSASGGAGGANISMQINNPLGEPTEASVQKALASASTVLAVTKAFPI